MTGQRKRREFPEAFKREAVERVRTSGLTIISVAKELDVHETVLRRWITRYGEPGMAPTTRAGARAAAGGLSPADLAAENARLKRENTRLQTERDILRKAALASVLAPSPRSLGPVARPWRPHMARSSGRPPDEVRVRG